MPGVPVMWWSSIPEGEGGWSVELVQVLDWWDVGSLRRVLELGTIWGPPTIRWWCGPKPLTNFLQAWKPHIFKTEPAPEFHENYVPTYILVLVRIFCSSRGRYWGHLVTSLQSLNFDQTNFELIWWQIFTEPTWLDLDWTVTAQKRPKSGRFRFVPFKPDLIRSAHRPRMVRIKPSASGCVRSSPAAAKKINNAIKNDAIVRLTTDVLLPGPHRHHHTRVNNKQRDAIGDFLIRGFRVHVDLMVLRRNDTGQTALVIANQYLISYF